MKLEDEINAIELELQRTPYNKRTEHHIGRLKAKLARLKAELQSQKRKGGSGRSGTGIKKSGDATVVLVGAYSGDISAGISGGISAGIGAQNTIFEKLVSAYSMDAKLPVGTLCYKGANIQILNADITSYRTNESLGIIRTADLICIVAKHYNDLNTALAILSSGNIKLNASPPKIFITKKTSGGICVRTAKPLTKISPATIKAILHEYKYTNAEVVIHEDITPEMLIEKIASNYVYLPAFAVFVGEHSETTTDKIIAEMQPFGKSRSLDIISVDINNEKDITALKNMIFDRLNLIRIYLKPTPAANPNYDAPLVLQKDSTVEDVCTALHGDFKARFKYAVVWGKSPKYQGQKVGIEHKLQDCDIVLIVTGSTPKSLK